jgi:hypothetical protein
MLARISITIACLAVAVGLLAGGTSIASPGPTAVSAGSLKPCPTLNFRGKHRVAQRNLGCGPAKQNAIFVVKRLKAPAGWKCSGRINKGYATCTQGRKAFSVAPA